MQVGEQPSELSILSSSQSSSAALTPSPHSQEQTLGDADVQVYPCSRAQVEEHPSLLLVFSSSHPSVEFLTPLPQVFKQTEGALEQE